MIYHNKDDKWILKYKKNKKNCNKQLKVNKKSSKLDKDETYNKKLNNNLKKNKEDDNNNHNNAEELKTKEFNTSRRYINEKLYDKFKNENNIYTNEVDLIKSKF